MDMRCLCCCNNFFIRCIQSSVTDIFHDCSGEQPCILKHHTEHLMKLASVEIFDIMAIYFDDTLIYIVETHQQFNHRRFTGTGRSYNCNLLSIMYICREIMNDDFIRIVTELNMFKLDIAFQTFNGIRIFRLLYFLFLIKKFKDSLRSCCGRLQKVCYLRDLLDRLCKVTDVLEK